MFIIATLGVLSYISWKLTLVTLGGVIPVVAVYVGYAMIIRKLQKAIQDKKGELGQVEEEAISNLRTVKAFACEKYELRKFEKKNQEAYILGIA